MSFKYRWTISSSYDFQSNQQHSQRRWGVSQTALLSFEVLPDLSLALPSLLPELRAVPRLVIGAPRLLAGTSSYSEGRQDCPPMVWYSLEIDASKFTLHILSDTPAGFQWLRYILQMYAAYCISPRGTVSRSQPVSELLAILVVLNSLHSHNYELTN